MSKQSAIIFLSCFIILIGVIAIVNGKRSNEIYLNMSFSGIVDNVVYDVKNMPTVTVKGEDYFIGGFYDFQNKIERGDSLVKNKGEDYFKLIKKVSGSILIYKQ